MKRERTSYAFLMEMVWVSAFFLICASVFVLVFTKAEQISRSADVLNQAVQAASNAMEASFAEMKAVDAAEFATEDFEIEVEASVQDGLLNVTVKAIAPSDGSVLYTLTGCRAVSEGGAA